MEGFGDSLRLLLRELDLMIESLKGFGPVILVGSVVAAMLVVFTVVRR